MNKELTITEMAKAAKKEYMRNWRKNNKDKTKVYQQKFWEKKSLEMNAEV